jgi:hypothetical protein
MDLGGYSATDRFRSSDSEQFVSTEETRTLNQLNREVQLIDECYTKCFVYYWPHRFVELTVEC